MILHSLKLTGTGAVQVALSTGLPQPSGFVAGNPLKAKFVQATAPDTNSATGILIGGNEVSATQGYLIPQGWAGQLFPPISEIAEFYDLSQIFANIPAADVLYILYGG